MTKNRICPSCGGPNHPTHTICAHCLADLPALPPVEKPEQALFWQNGLLGAVVSMAPWIIIPLLGDRPFHSWITYLVAAVSGLLLGIIFTAMFARDKELRVWAPATIALLGSLVVTLYVHFTS